MAKPKKEKAVEVEINPKFVCKSVSKVTFDNEEVVLENEHAKVTLNLKHPDLHGHFVKGESYDDIF